MPTLGRRRSAAGRSVHLNRCGLPERTLETGPRDQTLLFHGPCLSRRVLRVTVVCSGLGGPCSAHTIREQGSRPMRIREVYYTPCGGGVTLSRPADGFDPPARTKPVWPLRTGIHSHSAGSGRNGGGWIGRMHVRSQSDMLHMLSPASPGSPSRPGTHGLGLGTRMKGVKALMRREHRDSERSGAWAWVRA